MHVMSSSLLPAVILPSLRANSARQVLHDLSQHIGQHSRIDHDSILTALGDDDSHGQFTIGRGIALPHARLAGVLHVTVGFARLAQPVDFKAIDHVPVDLVFMLLAPDDTSKNYLTDLSRLTRYLRDENFVENLRGAHGADALRAVLMDMIVGHHAA